MIVCRYEEPQHIHKYFLNLRIYTDLHRFPRSGESWSGLSQNMRLVFPTQISESFF